jgi:hypothetical protein
MTIVTWKPAKNEFVLLAMVGEVKVGLVQLPVPGNRTQATYFSILLNDVEGEDEGWRETTAAARKRVEKAVDAWFAQTGLLPPKPAPQDETNVKTPIAVWVNLFNFMKEHPDAKIVTWDAGDCCDKSELHYVNYTAKTNEIELTFN